MSRSPVATVTAALVTGGKCSSMSNVLSEAGEKQLEKAEQIERCPAGMILFNEGEAPRGLLVIHSGVVDLEFSGRNGVSKSLRSARPGEVVGLSYAVSN